MSESYERYESERETDTIDQAISNTMAEFRDRHSVEPDTVRADENDDGTYRVTISGVTSD